MILLDSDIFTLLSYGHANVFRHYEAVREGEQIGVTAVTRSEALRGRTDSLLKAADERELLVAAKRLQATEAALTDFIEDHVDTESARRFKALRGP